MLIDYHAHVNFNAFKDDANEVIKRALNGGVFMVLVGTQIDTSRRAVKMAGQYEKGVWASVGLHPIHLEQMEVDESEDDIGRLSLRQLGGSASAYSQFRTRAEVFDPIAYRALTQHPKVVAIGECGLDYFHIANGRELGSNEMRIVDIKSRQHDTFRQHIDLAEELDLPLILHCRGSRDDSKDAYRDMLKILREYVQAGKIKRRGSIHCFVSTWDIAEQFLALDFHIGFTGVITFAKNGVGSYDEVVRNVPLDRILVETDCPFLAPIPMRGRRNEPLYVRYVAEKVAEIKGMEKRKVEEQLFENTLRVFPKISPP